MLNTMVESGLQYSKASNSSLPLMYHYYGTRYLGAAHGLAGILLVMLRSVKNKKLHNKEESNSL